MFRLLFGFFAGLPLGRNCSRIALRGSQALRQLADRLDRLAVGPERVHTETGQHEKALGFRPAA